MCIEPPSLAKDPCLHPRSPLHTLVPAPSLCDLWRPWVVHVQMRFLNCAPAASAKSGTTSRHANSLDWWSHGWWPAGTVILSIFADGIAWTGSHFVRGHCCRPVRWAACGPNFEPWVDCMHASSLSNLYNWNRDWLSSGIRYKRLLQLCYFSLMW